MNEDEPTVMLETALSFRLDFLFMNEDEWTVILKPPLSFRIVLFVNEDTCPSPSD
jgi:hypothetical protein